MIITRTYEFDMGHRLQEHAGLCRNVHGHRYVAHISVQGLVRDDGMVIDFLVLDALIVKSIGDWDHALMLEESDPVYSLLRNSMISLRLVPVFWPPTAENISQEIVRRLSPLLPKNVAVFQVVVFETPRSSATALP
jgi:6-pyruvoyltetrahydropterin/6-carboxytetrahydropterin synthase